MRNFYLQSRNGWYHYIRRIPSDLYRFFKFTTLRIPLKTKEISVAKAAVGAIDFELISLYGVLRTDMLDIALAERLVNKFLLSRLVTIRQRNQRSPRASEERRHKIEMEEAEFSSKGMGLETNLSRQARAEYLRELVERLRSEDVPQTGMTLARRHFGAYRAETGHDIEWNAEEKMWLATKFQEAEIEALDIDSESVTRNVRRLNERIDDLKEKCKTNYMLLSKVVEEFKEYYPTTVKRLTKDTIKNCVRECDKLVELIGNIQINEVNRLSTITTLKARLKKYPKLQGGKKTTSTEVINPKTANKYLMRLNAILRFASESEYLNRGLVTVKMFPVYTNPVDERNPYEPEDFERLCEALCTQPLWQRGENRNERFWAILFAVYHGIESQRIYEIEKEHVIFEDDLWKIKRETWKTVKTEARNALDVPIHDDLIRIGFVDWVDSHSSGRLFAEKAKDFGQWYNRRDKNGKGYIGFECRHVTDAPLKCLYSTRHSFQGTLYDCGVEIKIVKEAVGHAVDKRDSTRSRYTGRSTAKRIKPDIMLYRPFTPEMVERLRVRAAELFKDVAFKEYGKGSDENN